MRLRHIGISLAVLGLAVSAPIARAQESRDDKFTAWDTNRDGRLEIVNDAGHMLHHDQPQAVARLIEPFFAA